MSNTNRRLRVFIQPDHCVQCDAVRRKFDAAGVEYDLGTLGEGDSDFYAQAAKSTGFSSAPVVAMEEQDAETGSWYTYKVFGGNNPTLAKEAIEYVR